MRRARAGAPIGPARPGPSAGCPPNAVPGEPGHLGHGCLHATATKDQHFRPAVAHTCAMAATAVPLRSRRRSQERSIGAVGDDRLVARVRAGDDAAFEAIYDRYYRGLLSFCRHMLGSRHEAEDALQHSFASAYRALRGGSSAIELRPWLYTIARNRCLSALRSQRDDLDV